MESAVAWISRESRDASSPALALALAPMEGISDSIVRALLSELGGMDLCVTEFIRVTDRPVSASVLTRECPEILTGGRTPSGVPVMVQLLGGEAGPVAESARIACDLGAYGIDLNFGCPARRVNGNDGGAAILRCPGRLTEIIAAVRNACPKTVPVSAKIRLGWDNPDDVFSLVEKAQAGGPDWITIHGRTKVQMYKPSADWARIARARELSSVPVVANGDIVSPESLQSCRTLTRANAFMIGRGAFRVPNLFRWIRGLDAEPWSATRCVEFLERFVERVETDPRYRSSHGNRSPHESRDGHRAALNRLKGWTQALSETYPAIATIFTTLKRTQTIEDALVALHSIDSTRR